MSEVVFEVPGSDLPEWVVRAYEYPSLEAARAVWSEIEKATRNKKAEFSIWATTTPQGTPNLVIVCGARERLPVIDAPLYPLTPEEAKPFVLRRARVGMDASEAHPEESHFEMRERYGYARPVVIDEEGGVEPWQK